MTGNFKLQPSKHTRVAYYFDDGSAMPHYNDMRNFGTTKFCFKEFITYPLNLIHRSRYA